jgi:hypothetical protein
MRMRLSSTRRASPTNTARWWPAVVVGSVAVDVAVATGVTYAHSCAHAQTHAIARTCRSSTRQFKRLQRQISTDATASDTVRAHVRICQYVRACTSHVHTHRPLTYASSYWPTLLKANELNNASLSYDTRECSVRACESDHGTQPARGTC